MTDLRPETRADTRGVTIDLTRTPARVVTPVVPLQRTADRVSVVVPARNESAHIEKCLASIQAQEHRDLEILVVDGASTDDTADVVRRIARTDPRVRLLHNPDGLIPISLNIALAAATAPWLVRVDAHATIPPDYVGRAVEHLATGRWGGVGGRKDGIGSTPAGRAVAAAMGSPFGVGNSTYHYGTSLQTVEHVPFGAYGVDELRRLGGWDEKLRVNQDFELDYRLRTSGRELLFDPKLVIGWECRQHIPDLYRQYFRYGRGKVVVAAKHPRSLRARHLVAPALVGGLVASAAAAPVVPAASAAFVGSYAVALAAATLHAGRRLETVRERALVAPAFVAMHVGWGMGFWRGVGIQLAARRAGSGVGAA